MQTGLEGKPWWYGLGIGVGVGAVILILVGWQVIGSMNDEIAQQENRLRQLQKKIVEGQAAQAQLPQFREQVRTLELELDKLLRILPARKNTPDLLRRIRALADQGDFGFKTFTPRPFVNRDFYSEWPITINLTGDYHNLAMFFDRIGRLSRIINIENLSVSANRQADETIAANFVAKTFVYQEEEEGGTDGAASE